MNSKPSKSANKRDAQAVHALATRLLRLTDEQLAGIPIDDDLRDIVNETRRTTTNSAGRRQRLYLAKQLRRTDTIELTRACDALERTRQSQQRLFHQAERWRDRLVDERELALREFCEMTGHRSARLAQLVDDLGKSLPEAGAKQTSREIFRELHTVLSAHVQDGSSNG